MRPVLALCISVCFLGGLGFYLNVLQPQPLPINFDEPAALASGEFALEVTLTFDAGPDPFAIEPDAAPSVLVQFEARDVLRLTGPVTAGSREVAKPIEGIVAGVNEFFVQVSPQDQNAQISRAVRLRLLQDDLLIADQTMWSEAGQPIQGVMRVRVAQRSMAAETHEHD